MKQILNMTHQTLNSLENPNSSYIKVEIKLKRYKKYHLFAYLDTGASICVASKYIFPQELWKNVKNQFTVLIANKTSVPVKMLVKNINIKLCGEDFIFPTIYQQETGQDLIIGNNFLKLNRPFLQDMDWISITHHLTKRRIYCTLERNIIKVAKPDFLKQFKKENQQKHGEEVAEILVETTEEYLQQINKLEELKELLKDTSSENPLDLRINNSKEIATIKLRDETKVIRIKPMIYTPKDRNEFAIQIKELLKMNLITPSKSPQNS